MYDNKTDETSPTNVQKPTDCIAGCFANNIELTVITSIKKLKKIAVLWYLSKFKFCLLLSNPSIMNML